MRRALPLLLILLLLPACARRELTLLREGDLPEDVYESPEPTPTTSPVPQEGVIYLVRRGRLFPHRVTLQPVGSLHEALLFTLFQDREDGRTAIPSGTRLNGVSVQGTVATVDVSSQFEQAGPSESQALRIAQVVYTLTEPGTGIQAVNFEIEDVPQRAIPGGPPPVARDDYKQFAPPGDDAAEEDEAQGEG